MNSFLREVAQLETFPVEILKLLIYVMWILEGVFYYCPQVGKSISPLDYMQFKWINDDPQSNSYYKIHGVFSGE